MPIFNLCVVVNMWAGEDENASKILWVLLNICLFFATHLLETKENSILALKSSSLLHKSKLGNTKLRNSFVCGMNVYVCMLCLKGKKCSSTLSSVGHT